MSLIYNTLEKIESDSGGKKPSGRLIKKKKVSSSPVALVLIAAIISVVIYLCYMGFDYYSKKQRVKNRQAPVKKTIPVDQNQYAPKVDELEESPAIPEYELNQKMLPENGNSGNGVFSKASHHDDTSDNHVNTAPKTITEKNKSEKPVSVYQNSSDFFSQEQEQPAGIIRTKNDIKQLTKTAKIINTIADIKKTLLVTNDPEKLNHLLNRVKRLKGGNNSFVKKLEAVILMKSGNFDQAEKLLKNISINNGFDREIELNLAVIELNTGRTLEAKKRLQKLNQTYPEDSQILHLLKVCTVRS